jgi:hypothetical protein
MAMTDLTVLSVRLHVVSAVSMRIVQGKPGIVCVGLDAHEDAPPLVLIWDEDAEGHNDGCSATNAIAYVLAFLRQHWAGRLEVQRALVVERDSNRDFDLVSPSWLDGSNAAAPPAIGWRALRWPGTEPRSFAAFRGMFGARADTARDAVYRIQQAVPPASEDC